MFFTAAAMLWPQTSEPSLEEARTKLVDLRLKQAGIKNLLVLDAIRNIPRHEFVPDYLKRLAYEDIPLPMGSGQYSPAPSTVARMAEALQPDGTQSVLVVGLNTGYLAAVFSRISFEVAVADVSQSRIYATQKILDGIGFTNIQMRLTDGTRIWEIPRLFDCIVINGAVDTVPQELVSLLRFGGKMVIPLGKSSSIQTLVLVTKTVDGLTIESIDDVVFPPLEGFSFSNKTKSALDHGWSYRS